MIGVGYIMSRFIQYINESKINVESPTFKEWFGDSKIVNPDGTPMIVYHGTKTRFTRFNFQNAAQKIIWFTSDINAIKQGEVGAQGSGQIAKMYVKITHPAGWKDYDNLVLDQFKSYGFDGAKLLGDDNEFTGFVFKPDQIKIIGWE